MEVDRKKHARITWAIVTTTYKGAVMSYVDELREVSESSSKKAIVISNAIMFGVIGITGFLGYKLGKRK